MLRFAIPRPTKLRIYGRIEHAQAGHGKPEERITSRPYRQAERRPVSDGPTAGLAQGQHLQRYNGVQVPSECAHWRYSGKLRPGWTDRANWLSTRPARRVDCVTPTPRHGHRLSSTGTSRGRLPDELEANSVCSTVLNSR